MASFSSPSSSSTSAPEYSIYGDQESVGNVTEAIMSNCSAVTVVPSTPLDNDGAPTGGANTSLLPEFDPTYVGSYYRASSFALSTYFDDVAAQVDPAATVNFTAPATKPSLYPAAERDVSFQQCVNDTIATALPIEDAASAALGLRTMPGATMGVAALCAVLLGGGERQMVVLVLAMLVLVASTGM